MSRKFNPSKSAQPDAEQIMTQVWHGVVDTLRLLPTIPSITETSNETQLVDDALEKLELLIQLRKNETSAPPEKQPPTINIATPSTPTSSVGAGNGKRKRRPSISISPAPPTDLSEPPPSTGYRQSRSATPMSMTQSNKNMKKEPYHDQLPLKTGRRVAFRVPPNKHEENTDPWILATVNRCLLGDRSRYEVSDIDDANQMWRTTLRSLVPLADPDAPPHLSSHPSQLEDFPKGSTVLGLYPDTTSFYQATVIAAPIPGTGMGPQSVKHTGKVDPRAKKGVYLLQFVDDGGVTHEVDAKDVIANQP